MTEKVIFDASSLLYAWDTYPKDIDLFEPLWAWIESLIAAELLVMSKVNFDEVTKSTEAYEYLKDLKLKIIEPNMAILSIADNIRLELGLTEVEINNPTRKGVDVGDLICVATAKVDSLKLITEESPQIQTNGHGSPKLQNHKIPRVCSLHSVAVKTCNFVEFLKQNYKP